MSKAILVIDMPETCTDCHLFFGGLCTLLESPPHKACCNVMFRRIRGKAKPEWCQLKPVPEKLYVDELPFDDGFDVGWNACIDEILKGCGTD